MDRVLGGGAVAGAAAMISGEPGAGKSTMLGQWAGGIADRVGPVLIASGEEASVDVRARLRRTGSTSGRLYVSESSRWADVSAEAEQIGAVALVVDSLQTLEIDDLRPASPSAIHAVSLALPAWGRRQDCAVWIVCQIRSDGDAAGGTRLPHAVDVVFELGSGLLVTRKNRHGPVDRVRLRMTSRGLV
jgi:DNA repair protein RadA/Sms